MKTKEALHMAQEALESKKEEDIGNFYANCTSHRVPDFDARWDPAINIIKDLAEKAELEDPETDNGLEDEH